MKQIDVKRVKLLSCVIHSKKFGVAEKAQGKPQKMIFLCIVVHPLVKKPGRGGLHNEFK